MKTDSTLSIDSFTRILELAGIKADDRKRLHRIFEHEDPVGHEAFLSALNASPDVIRKIRVESA